MRQLLVLSMSMTRPQRIVFVTGYLAMTAVGCTIVGIVIHRIFPDQAWLMLLGPLFAVAAVFALHRLLSTRLQ